MKYKIGDKFRIKKDIGNKMFFKSGDILRFTRDDGSDCPWFFNESWNSNDGLDIAVNWRDIEPIEEPMFKVGDRVKIIDIGKHYSTFQAWADAVGAKYYMDHQSFKNGEIGEIKALAPHSAGGTSNNQLLALVHIDEPHITKDIIIEIEGIELVADDHEQHLEIHNEAIKQENLKKEGGEKNMAFTKGDKAIMHDSCGQGTPSESIGIFDGIEFRPAFDSPTLGWSCNHLSNWVLISSAEQTMAVINKLTKAQKESWTKDQQALYRVGITDNNGNVNGVTSTIESLVRVNHKALVAQAEADIAEAEQEEKEAKAKSV